MPAYYRASFQDFARTPQSEIEAKLAEQNARAAFPLQPDALFAWQAQLPELQNAVRYLLGEVFDAKSWSILLEYPIPRVGKRIDAVALARDVIIVIETKTGAAPTSAARQVDDYALNLACFHEGSSSRTIVPVVVSNAPVAMRRERTTFDQLIEPCIVTTFSEVGPTLQQIVGSHAGDHPQLDAEAWDEAHQRELEWENWFLDNDDDVRCSSRLEVFATQFEVQGLELDWVGVCWGEDFTWDGVKWVSNRFTNKKWMPRKMKTEADAQKHQFRVNSYRVLLTRARQGMIVYVPNPPSSDQSRLPDELERTAAYLAQCGAVGVTSTSSGRKTQTPLIAAANQQNQ